MKSIPYYVRALAMGLPAICFGLTLQSWMDETRLVRNGGGDLRLLYAGAAMVRTGHGSQLYDPATQKIFQDSLVSVRATPVPFTHPPFEALIFVPFSYLSYHAAFLCWMLVNLALLGGCFFLLRKELSTLKATWEWLPLALFVGFIPFSVALMQGQDSILLLTVLILAFLALRADCPLLAGIVLGCGVFRFQIALPIAGLFFLWRRWRFTAGFALSSSVCLLASLWVVGISGLKSYWLLLEGMSSHLDQPKEVLYGLPPSFMGNLRGLCYALLPFGSASLHYVVIALSVGALLMAWFFLRRQPIQQQFLAAILTSALVSYHFLSHDMSILLLPIILLLTEHAEDEGWLLALALVFSVPALDMIYRPLMFLAAIPIVWLLLRLVRSSSLESVKTHANDVLHRSPEPLLHRLA